MTQSQAFAIEVHGRSAGIVVGRQGDFTFFASDHGFRDLDRKVFRRVGEAERAAARVFAARRAQRQA